MDGVREPTAVAGEAAGLGNLVSWVVQQLTEFCSLLQRHIALTRDLKVVAECMTAAFAQCEKLEAGGMKLGP
eukprot:SAG31_NODE_25662_length_457_cov_0.692737_1_plen_71_part_10